MKLPATGIAALLVVTVACPSGRPTAHLSVPQKVRAVEVFSASGEESSAGWFPIEQYRWDFGDGTPALITASPVQLHRYAGAGTHTVRLEITDSAGRISVDDATVEVIDAFDPGENFLPPVIQVGACRTQGVADCLVDFGAANVGAQTIKAVSVRNVGQAPLIVERVDLGESGAFTLLERGSNVLRAGQSTSLTVAFKPRYAAAHAEVMRIASNAANLGSSQPFVNVLMRGQGTQVPTPRITVKPESCAFGNLIPGESRDCQVEIGNAGTAPLTVSALLFSATTPPEFTLAPPLLPLELDPLEHVTVNLGFFPELDGIYTGAMKVRSNDPQEPEVEVQLWGTANTPLPVAVARVQSVNGQPSTGGSQAVVRPLDDVELSGSSSQPSLPSATVPSYEWQLIEKPSTSTVKLTSLNGATTAFFFNSNGVDRRGLDVVGVFVVQLTVQDSLGRRSVNQARVRLETIPGDSLHVQLTWDDPHADIDLHLIRVPGLPLTENDCYYLNCVPGSGPGVFWGSADSSPHLDVDDVDGYGPENTAITAPAPGEYLVGVHYYATHDGSPDVIVKVRIYIHGVLSGDFETHLVCCNAYWEVARVRWAGTPSVEPVDAFSLLDHAQCPPPPHGVRCSYP